MGSRDRVVADCSIVKPLEKQGVTQKLEDLSDGQLSDLENKSAQNAGVSAGFLCPPKEMVKTFFGYKLLFYI